MKNVRTRGHNTVLLRNLAEAAGVSHTTIKARAVELCDLLGEPWPILLKSGKREQS